MSQKNVPPQPPESPEEWAQAVVDNISNNETNEGDLSDTPSAEGRTEPAMPPTSEAAKATDEEAELIDDGGEEAEETLQDGAEETSTPVEEIAESQADLETLLLEKDRYLETSRRVQAEFENYRKQVAKRESEARSRANESLISEILPVLDACDGALSNGAKDVEPIHSSLLNILQKQGLEKVDPKGEPFDPEAHEAVMHDESDTEQGPVVFAVLRPGYLWKGKVVRPSMVHVKG